MVTQAPSGQATDAEYSHDGSKIIVAMSNGDVRIYDAAAPKTAPVILNAGETDAWTAAFSPDGKRFVAGYSNGTALVWDVASGLPVTQLAGNAGPVISAQFNDQGDQIVTASEDGTVRVWYAQPRELRTEFTIPPGSTNPGTVAGDGYISGRILVGTAAGLTILSPHGQQQASINDPSYSFAAWSMDGSKIILSNYDGMLALWRASGQGYVEAGKPWPLHVSQLVNANINSAGSLITDMSGNFTIQIRNTDDGHVLRTLSADKPLGPETISPDGRQVVAGDYIGQIEEWNGSATTPKVLGRPGPPVIDIEYNQSGSQFVTVSASGQLTIWNARNGKSAISIYACPAPNAASFSNDGGKVVVACGDGTFRVFGTDSGQTLAVIQAVTAGAVESASFSPDDKSIVAAVDTGSTGYVQVWSAELSTSSLTDLERIASQRVPPLTAAQQQQYLNGVDG
jgi:WD40 repeat protein